MKQLQNRKPVIQVKNLYKVYRVGETKVYALNGVDFTMYRGEFCQSYTFSYMGNKHIKGIYAKGLCAG